MCGIAGIIDLSGEGRRAPAGAIGAMAGALYHRGPDEEGFLERPGLAFASRRLSIVGLADGQQPIHNEDQSVSVVFNGELFDYPEMRADLESRGHRFATHCDTELIPHRWEDHQEDLFPHLRGQFAFALWDNNRRLAVLARDRFGICPLYWTRITGPDGDWLLFASEVKGLLASGMVQARPDPRGINHLFTFYSLPGPVTCFEGVQLLPPGHYLRVQFGARGEPARVSERVYWQMDFPDQGQEDYSRNSRQLLDQFEEVLLGAVTRRLRADVPVVSYLSGGVDSSMVVALASKVRGSAIPTFTIQITRPDLDETSEASLVARHLGVEPVIVPCGDAEVLATYPSLIRAAEGPVIDTSCAALLLLAREVHSRGYKVALTGEGADEWLAGYPWHKVNRLLGYLDVFPGVRLSQLTRRLFIRLSGAPSFSWDHMRRNQAAVGGHNGWLDVYGIMSLAKLRFFSPDLLDLAQRSVSYEELGGLPERLTRWHPLNRELFLGARVHLAGLLLNAKGDRVAMHSSVETRYPFLDEAVFDFLARIPPRWKLSSLRDKIILRRLGERWLPQQIARRRKAMFRAPFNSFRLEELVRDGQADWVGQLLSEESLRRTGYFHPPSVERWRRTFAQMRHHTGQRASVEMGLVGVLATQLWHHTFIDGSLAELPSLASSSYGGVGRPAPSAGGHQGHGTRISRTA
jgi:asparagine synthase (glutamine-hydrolysing)